jgi:hypothetical protein
MILTALLKRILATAAQPKPTFHLDKGGDITPGIHFADTVTLPPGQNA